MCQAQCNKFKILCEKIFQTCLGIIIRGVTQAVIVEQIQIQRLQEGEELIGVYGVKDKDKAFDSLGFIVKRDHPH